eukprot:TCONS_00057513-protein
MQVTRLHGIFFGSVVLTFCVRVQNCSQSSVDTKLSSFWLFRERFFLNMLPSRGQKLASALARSLKSSTKNYSAAAVPLTESLEEDTISRKSPVVNSELKVTKLSNGICVASVDTGATVSRLSISSNVGSRHETAANLGINHLLKNASFLDNGERTSLRTVREVQEVGGSLEVNSSREVSSRTAAFLRNKLPEVMENIAPGITKPLYQAWEITDARNFSNQQNITVKGDDSAVNIENLHKAAYRTGLGNSLYCDDLSLGVYSSTEIAEYAQSNFVGNKMTIVGTDVSHDELVRYANDLFGSIQAGDKQVTPQQKYYGGDSRAHTSNEFTYASLVGEGVGMFNGDLATYLVLQRILGVGPYTKWGDNTQSSRLAKAAQAAVSGPLSINALNVSYSDSGLFGFNAITSPQNIGAVMKSAVTEIGNISKGQLSTEELERAKTQAKATILMLGESKDDLLDDLVKQITFNGSYVSPSQAVSSVDKVSVDNIAQAAKKLFAGKSTMSVTGNIATAPYADELM